jgi:hypothetical protein
MVENLDHARTDGYGGHPDILDLHQSIDNGFQGGDIKHVAQLRETVSPMAFYLLDPPPAVA